MHSVRKYPIDLTADWTLKQKYPPHIVFWGGGLPFRHPYQFYITFVSKMDFLPQIRDFILQKHSKLISKPNEARSFHFLKIFLNAKIFLGGRVRSGYRFFGNLTGEFGPENFFIHQSSNVFYSYSRLILEGLTRREWVWELIGN